MFSYEFYEVKPSLFNAECQLKQIYQTNYSPYRVYTGSNNYLKSVSFKNNTCRGSLIQLVFSFKIIGVASKRIASLTPRWATIAQPRKGLLPLNDYHPSMFTSCIFHVQLKKESISAVLLVKILTWCLLSFIYILLKMRKNSVWLAVCWIQLLSFFRIPGQNILTALVVLPSFE